MSNMATVSTCSKCGLSYRDSLILHQCAEWTKGHKEAKETQPMSDTLQEREDEIPASAHRVNSSGNCSISGCPCRGWSAQEMATVKRGCPHPERHQTATYIPCQDCSYRDNPQLLDLHQPAARGGGEHVRVELINGVEGQCVGVNDYRICGPKPWGGGSVAKSWTTDKNDVLRAFLTPDEKHAWLADDLQVVSVKQHHSLVAERERLLELLRQVTSATKCYCVTLEDGKCWQCQAREAINEQRSTPQ